MREIKNKLHASNLLVSLTKRVLVVMAVYEHLPAYQRVALLNYKLPFKTAIKK